MKDLFERWAAIDLVNLKDQGREARRMILKDVLPFIGDLNNIKDVRKGHITEITDRLLQRGVNRMAKVALSLTVRCSALLSRDLLESDPTALLSKKNMGSECRKGSGPR